jgi:hypothetical protein
MNINTNDNPIRPLWLRVLIFCLFLTTSSLLAAYLAIKLQFPSLYNVTASFAEYAIPFAFYWGFMHIPFMLIYGIPLLSHRTKLRYVNYFRLFCVASFLTLLFTVNLKIPFLLFPTIDAMTALICSLILLPPNKKDNPRLITLLKLSTASILILLVYFAYDIWVHRTPNVTKRLYANSIFTLQSIEVQNDYHKQLMFLVDLNTALPEHQICQAAQLMASEIMHDYPFDHTYNLLIKIRFNPKANKQTDSSYPLGELSLNKDDSNPDGHFACYAAYQY